VTFGFALSNFPTPTAFFKVSASSAAGRRGATMSRSPIRRPNARMPRGIIAACTAATLAAVATVCAPSAMADTTADLSVSLRTFYNNAAGVVGDNSFGYTIAVRNNGPSDAADVIVHSPIPATMSFRSSASDPRCALSAATVTCDLGGVTSGARAIAYIVASLDAKGTVVLSATASSELADPYPSDNTASLPVTVYQGYASASGVRIQALDTAVAEPWAHASVPDDPNGADFGPSFDEGVYGGGDTLVEYASIDRYTPQAASVSQVARASLYFGVVSATAVTARCTAAPTQRQGSLDWGSVSVYPEGTYNVPPPPNTKLTVVLSPVEYAIVILNEQSVTATSVTVDAIHMRVYNTLRHAVVADITLAQAVCSLTP
jgi:uncharacterized repeat protein (TIGR01451 family)